MVVTVGGSCGERYTMHTTFTCGVLLGVREKKELRREEEEEEKKKKRDGKQGREEVQGTDATSWKEREKKKEREQEGRERGGVMRGCHMHRETT